MNTKKDDLDYFDEHGYRIISDKKHEPCSCTSCDGCWRLVEHPFTCLYGGPFLGFVSIGTEAAA